VWVRPRRPVLSAALGVVALACLAAPAAFAGANVSASALDAGVLNDLNAIRIAHGLVPLRLDAELSAAAEAHSLDMLRKGYFSDSSANGGSFWQRIAHYYPSGGSSHWTVGENTLWSAGSIDAHAELAAWMASPPHRANILFPGWRQIGIATASASDAAGAFGGQAVTITTTDFGTRG
jgi:uncharacterized protein YkwD